MTGGELGCTYDECDAWCGESGNDVEYGCDDEKYKKCKTEPCQHVIVSTATSDLYCASSLCDVWCGTTPCDETHKPSCGTQCTEWCKTNTEDPLCEEEDDDEGGGMSVMVSLLLRFIALL
jgi:hypothetical protein